jgi:hypothetical protein
VAGGNAVQVTPDTPLCSPDPGRALITGNIPPSKSKGTKALRERVTGNGILDAPRAGMSGDGRPIRFGVFEVDLRSGELRKQGVRIKLRDHRRPQTQPRAASPQETAFYAESAETFDAMDDLAAKRPDPVM